MKNIDAAQTHILLNTEILDEYYKPKQSLARQVSSMIHSARRTVSPVENIVSFVLLDLNGRTDGQHERKQ